MIPGIFDDTVTANARKKRSILPGSRRWQGGFNEVAAYCKLSKKDERASGKTRLIMKKPMRFFKDFETLDKEELHLRTFLPIEECVLPEGSIYHDLYSEIINNIQSWKNVKWD